MDEFRTKGKTTKKGRRNVGPVGHFDKSNPVKRATSCGHSFFIFTLRNRDFGWAFHTCCRCRLRMQWSL